MGSEGTNTWPLLPEWSEGEVEDAVWIEAIEASRRKQFAELAEL